ncbi:adenosylcobinamide-GDP ribazoletransferase [Brevibacillus daliensis]|uniref:adenosylcobinamide-GDP ribazoletransferase n=1 Tax=Brevibacillus daliensis TaxID=2892995 RepID=UPI001E4770AC|nr:adenosylcobinamide-GDP ribazoletransferase [Brevibacillus daliensis]
MNAFFSALTFLTRIPVTYTYAESDWYKSARFYPLVGLVIGCLLALSSSLLGYLFPDMLAGLLLVSFWIWVTGGLHLDGWMDTADGLGSARTRERMIEIMKDSRVGAMGVIACFVLLSIKVISVYLIMNNLVVIRYAALLLAIPMMARMSMLASIYYWPYLHQKSGKGSAQGLKGGLSKWSFIISLLLSFFIMIIACGIWAGSLLTGITIVVHLLFNSKLMKELHGLSGDSYGALVEVTETLLLVGAVSYVHLGGMIGW